MIISVIKEKSKQWLLHLLCRLGLLTIHNQEYDDIEVIDSKSFSVRVLCNTTNTVIQLSREGGNVYFRECKKHLNSRDYIKKLNDDYKYFNNSSTTPRVLDKKKFMNMGLLANQYSRVRRFYNSLDPSVIGLENANNMSANDLKFYVDYIWSELYSYKLNSANKQEYQNYNSSRAIACYRIARLLDLEDLVPETKYVYITGIGDEIRFGTIMNEAKGISFNDIAYSEYRKKYLAILQKNLLNLNVLDVICYEKDHRPDNYNIVLDKEGKPESVCAFDNDSPMAFFLTSSVSFFTYEGCSPLIDKNGLVNRPYLDGKLYEKILSLNVHEINKELGKILNKSQIKCLVKRIEKVKAAIKKSIYMGKCILIYDDDGWTEETVKSEINGNYGLTYLGLFASDWVNPSLEK